MDVPSCESNRPRSPREPGAVVYVRWPSQDLSRVLQTFALPLIVALYSASMVIS